MRRNTFKPTDIPSIEDYCFYVGSFCQAFLTIRFKSPLGYEIVVNRLGWLVPWGRGWQRPF